MKNIMIIFGTRPECIKMAPIIHMLNQVKNVRATVCNTAQHTTMTDQMLSTFKIQPQYNLNVMTENQTLTHTTITILSRLTEILKERPPDLILVQGDTTTTFIGSLASFYHKIPVGHVEAGLRTFQRYNPFPEEINRRLSTVLADYHFPSTEMAKQNLLSEGINENKIFVTGNTVIDSLIYVLGLIKENKIEVNKDLKKILENTSYSRIVLITAHRRESFGQGLKNICLAIKDLAELFPHILFIYPVHLNPNVKELTHEHLYRVSNVLLCDPLDYFSFIYLMDKSHLILTDSGGIQEEAPSLGKPVLVMRKKTERPEGIEAGVAKIVGVDREGIVHHTRNLLEDHGLYQSMATKANPYGDGKAAERIVQIILSRVFS